MILKMFETVSRYTVIRNILRSPPFCQESKSNINTNIHSQKLNCIKLDCNNTFRGKQNKKNEYSKENKFLKKTKIEVEEVV